MNADDTQPVINQMVASLTANLWLKDAQAGEKAAKFNLKCMAGIEKIDETEVQFTGESSDLVIAIASAKAPESYIAHEALCEVATDLTEQNKALPMDLQRYIVTAATITIRRTRGGSILRNIMRDDAIYRAVQIGVKSGLMPNRNETANKESACSSAMEALKRCGVHLSEAEIVKIYKKRRDVYRKAWIAAGNSKESFQ